MLIASIVENAYRRIFEQMCLQSIDEDKDGESQIHSHIEGSTFTIIDQIRFFEAAESDRFVPLTITADADAPSMTALVVIPVELRAAAEIEILKVINRMNTRAGPSASSFNEDTHRISSVRFN